MSDMECNNVNEISDEETLRLTKPKSASKTSNYIPLNEINELNFKMGPKSESVEKKADKIRNELNAGISLEQWIKFAQSEGGLVDDELRKTGWPALLGLDPAASEALSSEESLRGHPEYSQVVLDVNRSLKRFPPGIPYRQRLALQDQLTNLILRVITKYPHLRYYQGYHDVAITFLLVVGEEMAFRIMEKLSTNHLRDCMEPTMEKTSYLLNYIYPLIQKLDKNLCDHIERSGCGTMFCLPWFLTWFGHSLNHYQDVVRLYDFFLASPPLMSLYLTAVLVHYRKAEILAVEPDMASLHCLLSQLPDDLPFDRLIEEALELYDAFPPEVVDLEVQERTKREKEAREREEAAGRARRRALAAGKRGGGGGGLKASLVRYFPSSKARLLLLAVSLAVGLFAYLKGGGGGAATGGAAAGGALR